MQFCSYLSSCGRVRIVLEGVDNIQNSERDLRAGI